MSMFKEYEGAGVIRKAYEISLGDIFERDISSDTYRLRSTEFDQVITFKAHQHVRPGDFVIRQSASDVYHCPRSVFLDKYRAIGEAKPDHGSEPPRRTEIEQMMVDLNCKGDYISSAFIHERIEKVDFRTIVLAGAKLMFCGIRMKGGFVVVGEPSACIDPSNWREEIGMKVAFENSFDKIYALEAYRKMGAE